ncbi:uncharacterized protein LOC124121640 [Haliotis rufescens]|uniref:uncharacterized protein LOC124121640 n=1 Tax=Haliotis rufescens TaxID=6454 RepID=UPI00201E7A3C|nr:uncharacterized protein LOC124121640 [Haliotis rufescens]
MNIAHKINEKTRTGDVLISEEVDFSSLLLSKPVIQGLQNSGFERPSPIQLKAIPLGRCGLDLIVQAKSGTGKTCVFSVIALEAIQVQSSAIQVLVLAPTREIAIQIWDVIKNIGSAMSALRCHTFIGGLPLSEDKQNLKKCQIAVGTPGRIKQLIETNLMNTENVRLFVLDEADKLLEDSFQEQINWIYSALPDNKQMLALSATYPESLAQHLTRYMRNPTFMRLNISDPALLGIRQYYKSVAFSPMANLAFEAKTKAVIEILSGVSFQQCLIFSNLQTRAQNLSDELQRQGWPTACIAGSHEQKDRLEAMAKLKTYKCRVLISTDLTARGIDADKVNLVINLDVPRDHETYLHRIGRAGRFGSYGAAVTVISEGQEQLGLSAVERKCNTNINSLPDPLPRDLLRVTVQINLDDMVTTEQLITRPDCGNRSRDLPATSDKSRDKDRKLEETKHEKQNTDIDAGDVSLVNGCAGGGRGDVDEETGSENICTQSSTNGIISDKHSSNTSERLPENIGKGVLILPEISSQIKQPKSEYLLQDPQSSTVEPGMVPMLQPAKCLMDENKRDTNSVDSRGGPSENNKPGGDNSGQTVSGCDVNQTSDHTLLTDSGKKMSDGRKIKTAKKGRKRKANSDSIKESQSDPSSYEEKSVAMVTQINGQTQGSSTDSAVATSIKALLGTRQRICSGAMNQIELTVPSYRESLGRKKLTNPHTYSSALVDYETFLEQGDNGKSVPNIPGLVLRKIDHEKKDSTPDADFVRSVADCVDRMYDCALSQIPLRGDNHDMSNESVGDATAELSVMPVSRGQMCSKTTQTTAPAQKFNQRPKSVRYDPMSVSSLAMVDLDLAVRENKENFPQNVSNNKAIPLQCVEGLERDTRVPVPTADGELPNQKGHVGEKRSKEDEHVLVEKVKLSKVKVGSLSVNEYSVGCKAKVDDVSNIAMLRNGCELMYVSDGVGRISMAADAVTVEEQLMRDCRPRSRKGKMMAGLDGLEYGRKCGRHLPDQLYGTGGEVVSQGDTDSSDSDSSSSSSEYDREVFRNNYVDDPVFTTRRQPDDTYERRNRDRHSDHYSSGYDNEADYLPYDNQYVFDEQDTTNVQYSDQVWGNDNDFQPNMSSYPYDVWSQPWGNPWGYYHPHPNWYPPPYYAPPQYYPSPYLYPPAHCPAPPHPMWYGGGGGYGRVGLTDEERIDAMRKNMEYQRAYIKKMAKIKY